jgi:hypothetical protein
VAWTALGFLINVAGCMTPLVFVAAHLVVAALVCHRLVVLLEMRLLSGSRRNNVIGKGREINNGRGITRPYHIFKEFVYDT